MSHFSLMVVTDSKPTEEELEKLMQPYHEFECTGIDDEYVVEVDETEKYKKKYEEETTDRIRNISNGELFSPYEDWCYREPTEEEKELIGPIAGTGAGNGISWHSKDWDDGLGYRAKVRFLPEGFEEVTLPVKEVQTFRDFISDETGRKEAGSDDCLTYDDEYKYGYTLIDKGEVIKTVDRTNPNSKWDYWRIGGRYRSKLQVRKGVTTAVSTEPTWEFNREFSDAPIPEGFDQACVEDIDLESMKAQAVQYRQEQINDLLEKTELSLEGLEIAINQSNEAHRKWLTLEPDERPRGNEYIEWLHNEGYTHAAILRENTWNIPTFAEGQTPEEWVNAAPALTSYAVLKDGKWYQRGEMGWFGCSTDEDDNWEKTFNDLFASLKKTHWITFLDCHI